jgi:hypothetical protein
MRLSTKDYVKILNYYSIPVPSNPTKLKKSIKSIKSKKVKNIKKSSIDVTKTRKLAHKVLALKLCRCIKRVQKQNPRFKMDEQNAIPICINQIFKKHGIKPYRFSCKKGFIPLDI